MAAKRKNGRNTNPPRDLTASVKGRDGKSKGLLDE